MNEDLINVRMLTPFRKFIMSVGEIPSAYMDSMTYYEMLNWFCNYLQNEVIPSVNNNASAVTQLQNLYNELKEYVDNYFDNLDVQEEINNKLDDMVEHGQLQEIIGEYVNNFRIVNVLNHGAKGNGIDDDTIAINSAITYAKTNNINNVYIPNGEYLINGTILLPSNINLYGAGKNVTILKNGNSNITNFAMITTENYNNKSNPMYYINLHDLSIQSNGIRSKYDIELFNISYSNIYNVFFNRINIIDNNETDLHGLLIERDTLCQTESVVNKIYNCQIRNGKIKLVYTTDNYIDKNEIWAPNCQDCALEINRSFNNSICNNQIVGGFIKGGLLISHNSSSPIISGNKIVNNYFDGSYSSVNSKDGIHIDTNIENTLISNNLFYISKTYSIFVNENYFMRKSIISNNIFQESNKIDDNYDDICALNNNNECNIISNNMFYNNNKENKGYPINYNCTSNSLVSKSIISNNCAEYPSGYNKFTFDKYNIILNDNSDLIGNNNDLIVVQQNASQSINENSIINLNVTKIKKGDGLTLSNNKIIIGDKSGIKTIHIKANILCYGTLNVSKTFSILKNNSIVYMNQITPSANNFNLNVETTIDVNKDDEISFQINGSEDNVTTTIGSSSTNEFMVESVN